MRNLIAEGVDAIIVNPISPEALNPAHRRGDRAGASRSWRWISPSTAANTYNCSRTTRSSTGTLAPSGCSSSLKGTGNVLYMRGAAGASADTDRDAGFKKALAEYPDIKIGQEVFTNWDQATGVQQVNDYLATGQALDGIWTSGIDNVIVDALQTAGHAFVPSRRRRQRRLRQPAARLHQVPRPRRRRGDQLGGRRWRRRQPRAPDPRRSGTGPGQEPDDPGRLGQRDATQGRRRWRRPFDADIIKKSDLWPLVYALPPWTTYTKEQIIACKGPERLGRPQPDHRRGYRSGDRYPRLLHPLRPIR